jgi:ATP-binding cassette subfamily B protein
VHNRVRHQIADHLRQLGLGFFVEKGTGNLNTLLITGINRLDYSFVFPYGLTAIVLPGFISVYLFTLDWRMALATLAGIPLALLAQWLTQRQLKKLISEREKAHSRASSRIIEYIQGMPVIRAFQLSGSRFSQYEQAMRDYRERNIVIATKTARCAESTQIWTSHNWYRLPASTRTAR